MLAIEPRKIESKQIFEFEFSVCTLVTAKDEYNEMCNSFRRCGFTSDVCEYLYIDNSKENTFDAFAGLNRFLNEAKGRYIILCHQDILLERHDINDLRKRIVQVSSFDPYWAILANAGGINLKHTAMHLIRGTGDHLTEKNLPLKTATVDENFFLVRNDSNLSLSADLTGFHLYGTDICLIADILGYNSYVIDFKIIHKSDGNADRKFFQLKKIYIKKYNRALRSRFIGTTITRFYISGNKVLSVLGNLRFVLFLARQYYKLFRPKRKYSRKV